MGQTAPALLLAAVFLAALIAISAWAAAKLPSGGQVAVHFDIRGKANAFGPRWFILGLMPACHVLMSGFLLWAVAGMDGERVRELLVGQTVAGLSFLAAHVLCMVLLVRWARTR